ncbi:MAG: ABC transporter ATP-binding protein [bacterium]|nr:ABC transporter ATP-binding protein [bacterium]
MFSFSKIFKYVWPQIYKFKWAFYGILILFSLRMIVGAIFSPYFFKKIIDILTRSGNNHVAMSQDLWPVVFIVIGLNFLVIVIARSGRFVYADFKINIIRELRNFTFQKIEQNSPTFFTNIFAGSLVTKSRRFVGSFDSMFDIFIYNFLMFAVILIGVFIVLTKESPTISLIFLVWVILHVSVVSFFVIRGVKYNLREAEQDSKISGRLADVFSNISAVKFFSARKSEINSFSKYTDEGALRSRRAWFFNAKLDLMQGIFIFFVQSILLYVMISLWLKNEISTGTVVLIQTYMVIVFERLWEFGNSLSTFIKSASDMKEMVDIFEIVPDILDPQNPEILKMKEGHIIFQDVSFKYTMGDEVLNNFSLDIKPGERVGVVGHSGAGKSTITRLLLRFNDVTTGTITIDGQDVKNITQDDLRSVISYVPQEPILFHRPIRENISYGKPEATNKEVEKVAKKAHAHEFIKSLPQGYDTLVGERGVKLSGGERQRVAIARAMLKESPILILDEATSSLDSISESYIQESFGELMKGKTTIVIAHRLSTIQKMDRIIVLDKGAIVEEGTHKELLERGGLYADLWGHQTGGFLD